MNATQDRDTAGFEAGGLEAVQARGWELKRWTPSVTNHQMVVTNAPPAQVIQIAAQEYRLGHRAYALGDAKAAFDHFQVAIETDPSCVKAHRWLGRVALELGLGAEAKRAFEKVIGLQGHTVAVGQSLEYADEVCRFGLEAASQFRAGCEAQKDGRLNDASVAFGRTVASDPNHQRAWARLGQILLELKSYDGAVIACERALALEPHDSGSAYRLRLASKHTGFRVASLEATLGAGVQVPTRLSVRGRR